MFEGWLRARAVLKFHHSFLDSAAVESLVYPDNNLPHKPLYAVSLVKTFLIVTC